MPLPLAITLLVIVAVLIGAAGMFFALSEPYDNSTDDVAERGD